MRPRSRLVSLVGALALAGCSGGARTTLSAGTTTTVTTTTTTTTVPLATTTVTTPKPASTTATTKAASTTTTTTPACPSTLAGQMAATGGGSQLVTVVAPSTSSTSATVTLWQRSGACWRQFAGPWSGWVGYAGMSATKVEGDGRSPIGLFGISSTFYGINPNPGVHGGYHQLVCGDWWDEEPSSPEYNTFQHVSPCSTANPFGGGSEALWKTAPAYDYFAVVEYNTGPIIAGKGSAIFIHVSLGGSTNGCVSLPVNDLLTLLRWLQSAQSPHIAIGTTGDIHQL